MENNKLWEGHRLMYPEMREMIVVDKKEKVNKPTLSEEVLELFDEMLTYALKFKRPLLITYFRENKLNECIFFSFKIIGDVLQCDKGRKINFSEIIDLKLV